MCPFIKHYGTLSFSNGEQLGLGRLDGGLGSGQVHGLCRPRGQRKHRAE